MNGLHVLICLLTFSTTIKAGSHSLWAFATYILGETPFPEFNVVLMLDDVQFGYYDSDERRLIHRTHKETKHEDAITQEDARITFGDVYESLKKRTMSLKHLFNHTDGIHVNQKLVGCELLNNEPGPLMSWDAFNGLSGEELHFNMHQKSLQVARKWPFVWDKLMAKHIQWMYAKVYHPICIKTLRRYLTEEKNHVMRKVKPRVRLLQKSHPDSGGVQVSCLATGFYPRHINLTLLRDGQPVADHQITGGVLLPNGDGTYQMRKSLELRAEDLREKHHYTCTATHLSLDNKLNVTLEYDPGSDTVSIVSSLSVLVLVCLIVPTAAFIIWRRRRRAGVGSKTSLQRDYSPASRTEQIEASEDTVKSDGM